MAKAPKVTSESLVVKGSSSVAVLERARIAAARFDGVTVVETGPGVIQIARTRRRVLGRAADVCTVHAVEEPQRLIVTITGQIDPKELDSLRAAILGHSTETMHEVGVDSFRPPESMPATFRPPSDWFVGSPQPPTVPPVVSYEQRVSPADVSPPPDGQGFMPAGAPVDDRTMHRLAAPPSPPPPPRSLGRARSLVAHLSTGDAAVVRDVVLIGRSPSLRVTDSASTLIQSVADPAMSKSHLALGRSGDGAWVEDRSSTNGTMMLDASGRSVMLVPETRVVLSLPGQLIAGDTTIRIEWEG